MAEKDIMEKSLEGFNDVFADIVNGLLFNGEARVKEDSLEEATTSSYYKAEKIRGQDRDVAKYWNTGQIRIALLGFENQTCPEKEFPLRAMGYDGAIYRNQLSVNDARRRKKEPPNPLYPAVTLVLYFGIDKRWDQSLHLKDCFKIPAGLEPYVNDYKVHLFEVAWLTDEQVSRFKSDFRLVAEYFTQMRKDPEHYEPSNQVIIHVREFLHLISVMTGNDKMENNYNIMKKEGGTIRMRDLFTIMQEKIDNAQKETEKAQKETEKAREKIIKEQEKTKNAMVNATLANIESLIRNLNMTPEQAFDGLGIAEKDRKMYRSKISIDGIRTL